MKPTTYTVTFEWMLAYPLDLTETVIFAIIYGFSQDGDSTFRGSWKYLQDHAKCSRAKVSRSLKRLVELGLVTKRDLVLGGVKFCEYTANTGSLTQTPPVSYSKNAVSLGDGGGITERHNNIVDNAEDKSSANRGYIERADARTRTRETTQSFDFPGALVALGVDRKTAEDWTACRKSKGARNSESEFNFVANEIRTVCARDGVTPQQCVAFAAGNTWRGFKASWEETKQIKTNETTKYDPRTGRKIYTGDTI